MYHIMMAINDKCGQGIVTVSLITSHNLVIMSRSTKYHIIPYDMAIAAKDGKTITSSII